MKNKLWKNFINRENKDYIYIEKNKKKILNNYYIFLNILKKKYNYNDKKIKIKKIIKFIKYILYKMIIIILNKKKKKIYINKIFKFYLKLNYKKYNNLILNRIIFKYKKLFYF